MKALSKNTGIHKVQHEIHRREVSVARKKTLGPHIMAVTFTGESLSDFVSPSFQDHIKLFVEDGSGETFCRDYTPRYYDRERRELTLEMGIHEGGKGSDWAKGAKAGDKAVIAGPKASMIIPPVYSWYLLVGDTTSLPAIHRRLEELPPEARAIVRIHAPAPGDRRAFEVSAQVDARWFSSPEPLLECVTAEPVPDGEGFVWCAGEASLMQSLQRVYQKEKGFPRTSMKIGVYWKKGAADFHGSLVRPIE
ncbi:MAG: siderophore-interacting protein [Puniceicoccales bacterium]